MSTENNNWHVHQKSSAGVDLGPSEIFSIVFITIQENENFQVISKLSENGILIVHFNNRIVEFFYIFNKEETSNTVLEFSLEHKEEYKDVLKFYLKQIIENFGPFFKD